MVKDMQNGFKDPQYCVTNISIKRVTPKCYFGNAQTSRSMEGKKWAEVLYKEQTVDQQVKKIYTA